jgi:hypothetical protein
MAAMAMVEVHEQRLVQLPQLVIRPRRLLAAPASMVVQHKLIDRHMHGEIDDRS